MQNCKFERFFHEKQQQQWNLCVFQAQLYTLHKCLIEMHCTMLNATKLMRNSLENVEFLRIKTKIVQFFSLKILFSFSFIFTNTIMRVLELVNSIDRYL